MNKVNVTCNQLIGYRAYTLTLVSSWFKIKPCVSCPDIIQSIWLV